MRINEKVCIKGEKMVIKIVTGDERLYDTPYNVIVGKRGQNRIYHTFIPCETLEEAKQKVEEIKKKLKEKGE